MSDFLDLLEAFHHWCVSGETTHLEPLADALDALVSPPVDPRGWYELGTSALDGVAIRPPDWDPRWRILSGHELTLTVEALEYLEARRPGAIAAVITEPSPPLPQTPKPSVLAPFSLSDAPVNWGLTDVINCVSREIQKREARYPELVRQARLSPERARQEVGQMKAALQILTAMRDNDQDARQERLFE